MDQDPKSEGSDWQPKPKRRIWRILVILLIGGALGVAAYMIVPSMAWSESVSKQVFVDTQRELQQAVAAQVKLEKDLAELRREHAASVKRGEAWNAADKVGQTKLTTAETSIARVSQQLKEAQQASQTLKEKVAATEGALAQAKAEATKAQGRSKELVAQLASAAGSAKKLSGRCQGLLSANNKLKASLETQRQGAAKLKGMLSVLDVGPTEAPSSPARPAEMPITRWELARRLGQPTLAFAKGRALAIRWGKSHTARTVDDIVTAIDGKPACREVLASAAGSRPWQPDPPGRWRVGEDERLYYVDLVAMFGRPERIGGSAARFKAWWTIGAWARAASATVVNGVVTEFAGTKINPAVCCELARHRREAYREATPAVKASAASARDWYRRACQVISARLKAEADVVARDGVRLQNHSVAPFDSVGVWIAPAGGPDDPMTVRAAVNCTWVRRDGTTTRQRRYVVVTLTGRGDKPEVNEFAVLTPGE